MRAPRAFSTCPGEMTSLDVIGGGHRFADKTCAKDREHIRSRRDFSAREASTGNAQEPMPEPPRQLPLSLGFRERFGREDFLAGPSNAAALALIERWPDWPARAVALVGPEGAGKSHLA